MCSFLRIRVSVGKEFGACGLRRCGFDALSACCVAKLRYK